MAHPHDGSTHATNELSPSLSACMRHNDVPSASGRSDLTAALGSVYLDPRHQAEVQAQQLQLQSQSDGQGGTLFLPSLPSSLTVLTDPSFSARLEHFRFNNQVPCSVILPIPQFRMNGGLGKTITVPLWLSFTLAALDMVSLEARVLVTKKVLCEIYKLDDSISTGPTIFSMPIASVNNPMTPTRMFEVLNKAELWLLTTLHVPLAPPLAQGFSQHLARWREFDWDELISTYDALRPHGGPHVHVHEGSLDEFHDGESQDPYTVAATVGAVTDVRGARVWAFPPAVSPHLSSTMVNDGENDSVNYERMPPVPQWDELTSDAFIQPIELTRPDRVLVKISAEMMMQTQSHIYQRIFFMHGGIDWGLLGQLGLSCFESLKSWESEFGMHYVYHPLLFAYLKEHRSSLIDVKLMVAVCTADQVLSHLMPEAILVSSTATTRRWDTSCHNVTGGDRTHWLLQWPKHVLENLSDKCDEHVGHRALLHARLHPLSHEMSSSSSSSLPLSGDVRTSSEALVIQNASEHHNPLECRCMTCANHRLATYRTPLHTVFYLACQFKQSTQSYATLAGHTASSMFHPQCPVLSPALAGTNFIYPILHGFCHG